MFPGYLTIKALIAAFSQAAYDEDMKKAQQRKVLYRTLFGRFAYIAADIPILLILLAGLLAVICSVTTLLRVVLFGLVLAAAGYAIWFRLYISKHQRISEGKNKDMTSYLSEEEERAWKRSDRWHNIVMVVVLGALCLLLIQRSI